MRIDFNNIYNQDKIILPKIYNNLKKIIKKGKFILGDEVKNFEKNFQDLLKQNIAWDVGMAQMHYIWHLNH